MDSEIEITELHDITVERQDAVAKPASGFRFIITKSAAADLTEEVPAVENETESAPVTKTEEAAPETSEAAPEAAPASVTKAEFDALREAVEKMGSAVAEANERASAAEGREAAAKAELEALKATPIPGGPVLAATNEDRQVAVKAEAVRKAAYWQSLADKVTDPSLSREYANRARLAKAEAE